MTAVPGELQQLQPKVLAWVEGSVITGELGEALRVALGVAVGVYAREHFRLKVRHLVRPELMHPRSPTTREEWAELYVNAVYAWTLATEPGLSSSKQLAYSRLRQCIRFAQMALDSSVK